ncbi:MAG: dihydrofolate reductase [Bacteroidales bacterium]|nr:dihydrofolate reductase [Bacteroidales bacterium]
MEKCLIVAVADDGAIGIRGELPWHISEDLKYFKRTTLGCPVIMGRGTWESIGRPLPGRKNIVLTSRDIPGVCCVRSLDAAFEAAEPAPKAFIIGGAAVYKAAIDLVDKMYVTHVHTKVSGADAYFPEIDSEIWHLDSSSELFTDPASGLSYEFRVYVRVSPTLPQVSLSS